MTQTEKVIDRIRKLLAHADSAKALGSAEEAATFAAKASELLMQHKLDISELEMQEEMDEEIVDEYFDVVAAGQLLDVDRRPMSSKKRSAWLQALANQLARAHFCRVLYIKNSKILRIVGKKSDREIVLYLFTVLAREGSRLGREHYHMLKRRAYATGGQSHRDAHNAFLLGFVVGIAEQLKAMRDRIEHKGGQFALVRFGEAERVIEQYMESIRNSLSKKKAPLKLSTYNADAFRVGREAGRKTQMPGGLGSATQHGSLARGQQLLGKGGDSA